MKIRDIELNLHPNEDLSNHIRREGDFFEAHILDYLRANFPIQKTILDVGANLGNHTVYFAEYFIYKYIYAFEPVPENFLLLNQNTQKYRDVILIDAALSDHSGKVNIHINHQNMGASEVHDEGGIEVLAYQLDNFRFTDVTLIKIDVEWHEPQVIAGALETIKRNQPLILIEDHFDEYGKLLPGYEKIKAWPDDKTYLYSSSI